MQRKHILIFLTTILGVLGLLALSSCQDKHQPKIPELPQLANELPELKEQIESADRQAHKKPSSENLGKLGMIYYASNDYERAAKCFELAIQEDPEIWEWKYYQGSIHMELGELTEAVAVMKVLTQLEPEVWMAWYRLGEIYQQMDSLKLAEEVLDKIIQLPAKETKVNSQFRSIEFPLQLYARIIRSKVYDSTNRAEMAEQDLKDICKNHKTFGAAFRQLGMFYINQGEKDLGEVYQERANDLRVFNFATDTLMDRLSLISRSEAYVLKQIDNAMQGNDGKWSYELIKQAHENMPNSKYVLSKAIRQYSSIGMGKQALPLLDEHFEYFKEDYDEMLQIGIKLSGAGYRKEAAKYLEQAWSFEDQSPEQKATLAGMFLENTGMANRAIELMSTVVEANPDNETVLGDAVFLMLQTNQTDKAFQYFNSLKKRFPDNANIKIFQGIQAEKNGKIREAISFFRAAYEEKPKNKFLKSHLSELYVQEQLWSPALEFFRSALELNPNDSELQMYIGLLLVTCPDENLIDLEEGKEYSERAFYNSRYNINNRISAGRTLAIAHYQLADRKNALFYINKTIQLAEQASVSESYIRELKNLAQRFS